MVEFIGILHAKVVKGTRLAVRDMLTSDPYVVLISGQQVNLFCLRSIIFFLVKYLTS